MVKEDKKQKWVRKWTGKMSMGVVPP